MLPHHPSFPFFTQPHEPGPARGSSLLKWSFSLLLLCVWGVRRWVSVKLQAVQIVTDAIQVNINCSRIRILTSFLQMVAGC